MSARELIRRVLLALLVLLIVVAMVWTAAFGTVSAPS